MLASQPCRPVRKSSNGVLSSRLDLRRFCPEYCREKSPQGTSLWCRRRLEKVAPGVEKRGAVVVAGTDVVAWDRSDEVSVELFRLAVGFA